MTKQKGICQECKVEYEYEYNPKYPRKYCPVCSAAKKQAYEDNKPIEVVKVGESGVRKPEVPYGSAVENYPAVPDKYIEVKKPNPYAKDPVGLAVELMIAGKNEQEAIGYVKRLQDAFS